MAQILNIYSDGGCAGNQNDKNLGGWGAILEFGDHKKELHGSEADTTNNRMELTAVISAFSALNREGLTVRVFTDSSYVADCFRKKWYVNWEKNGWKTSQKKPVENQELWQTLLALVRRHDVSFYRVKGHVNPDHPSTNMNQLYEKFVRWNGTGFSFEDFLYITEMNNRADELANIGIDEIRQAE
ncbi:MAG: ribonuclease HI [Hornefia butyriciproducens]|uniref:ribonuclease H family protein n=1 Tax=Hornefia butyriciproducens TaxID=2652293 RepID=UPI002A7573A5|nr:ribonuclease HI [Hornefia butyriciproducens]MDY2991508.1 ribonuclease HI [Hornefia butyriciproducens]